MKHEFSGFGKIFSFTFTQHIKERSYKISTVVLALLCLILPAVIIAAFAAFGSNGSEAKPLETGAQHVLVVNDSGLDYDFNALSVPGYEAFSDIAYDTAEDVDQALAAADGHTLVLQLEATDGAYMLRILLPEDSELTWDDAEGFESYLNIGFSYVLMEASGLRTEQMAVLFAPVQTVEVRQDPNTGTAGTADGFAGIREVLAYLIPYLNVMVLYFLVLIYGQSVSNSVIMEKTSKLMDTFLVAVRPPAMVLGKVLAICLAAIVQFALWLLMLLAGLGCGCALARAIGPDTSLALVALFDNLDMFSSVFSLPGILLGFCVVMAGFLLYCALASIGGAMASKPEDLSSTNMLFTLALIASFFLTIYSGGMTGVLDAGSWLNYFPFSAILTVPGLAALGAIPLVNILASIGIIVLCALILMYFAGKIYKMMALYKGNPPKLSKIFSMLRTK
mgnify:FL=1